MKAWKLLGASALALALVACESKEDKAVRFAENAQQYLEEGETNRAGIQFANALKNDPNNIAALRGAAQVAEEDERYGDQLRYLQRLISNKPGDLEALAKLSRLNLLSGNPENALDRADQVLEQDPDNIEALTVKGAALVLQNNLDGASETLEKALAQAPENAEVRNLLAARYVRDEDFNQAQQIVDEGLSADPENEQLLVVKLLLSQRRQDVAGMDETFAALTRANPENGFYKERYAEFLLAARNDRDAARDQLRAAIPLLEDRTQAVGRLIGIIRAQEGNEAAEAELREIVADYPDTNLVFAIPSFLCEIGDTERCQAELNRLATSEEVTPEIRSQANVQLGERAFNQQNLDEALRFANDVLTEDETNPDALTLKAKVQLARDEVEPAIETLRTALNSDPDKESALILLGLAYEADGRASFGENQLAQAIDRLGLSPNLFQAYRGMLIRNGKPEDAADLTLRFAQTPDASRQVQRESAAVLIGQERFEEAETVARSLIRADPNDQDARRLLATTLLQQARNDEAIEALDQMSEEAQDELASVRIRSEALARSERFDDLRTYLDSKIEEGELPEAYILKTQVEASQGNLSQAANVARSGIEAFPGSENIYLALFNVHLAQADMEAANTALDRGIENAETTANLRVLRVNQYLQDGQREEARDVLMSLSEDGQLNNLSANNLAALMLDLGDDPAEALEIARRFEGTEQPFFADTLAWAFYRNGNLEKAEEYAAIAGRSQTPNAEIFYHRGVIAAANGDAETARTFLERALEAPGKTDTVTAETIQTALDEL